MSDSIMVFLLSHMFPSPRDRRFGAFVYDQACALADLGVSLDVVSPVPMTPRLLTAVSPKWAGYYQTPRHCTIGPFDVKYPRWVTLPRNVLFPSTGGWMARALLRDKTMVTRLREADLIHAHAALPDGDCARVVAARLGKKYILTVHGSDILLFPSRSKATFDATQRALMEAKRVIAVSSDLARRVVGEFGVPPARVAVIPNGYDPTSFFSRAVTGLPVAVDGSFIFLFVGWMLRSKGIFDIIEAAELMQRRVPAAFAKCEWWFVGRGDDTARFAVLASRSPAADRVRILGELPHGDVGEVMRGSSCLVLPSWSEGFGIVLVEALACGIPVIASDVGGIPEIVTPDVGILVPPRSPAVLCRAFETAIGRTWDQGTIVGRAKQYMWASSARLVLQMYRDVLGECAHG